MSEKRILDIGCGRNKTPGSIGMDGNSCTQGDVIHNLDDIPYSFADNQFHEVISGYVIKHVAAPLAVMTELHRMWKGTPF